jgi:hypothetical protein
LCFGNQSIKLAYTLTFFKTMSEFMNPTMGEPDAEVQAMIDNHLKLMEEKNSNPEKSEDSEATYEDHGKIEYEQSLDRALEFIGRINKEIPMRKGVFEYSLKHEQHCELDYTREPAYAALGLQGLIKDVNTGYEDVVIKFAFELPKWRKFLWSKKNNFSFIFTIKPETNIDQELIRLKDAIAEAYKETNF